MPELSNNLLYLILFRTLQTALEAAPTFLCGLVVAGLLRGIVGPQTLRHWLTNDPRLGPIRACLMGLLLPVCSLGVLPVAWELRRAGIARATVLTFLGAAPLANPISLVYAYQKLEGQGVLAVTAFASLLLGALALLSGMGILLGRWLPEPVAARLDLPPVPASAPRRLLVVGICAARGLTGILLLFLIVGLIGSGLLAICPKGALEQAASDKSMLAPLHVALVSLPAQIPPEQGVMLLCDLLFMGVSLGKAFVFFVLGLGVNIGTVAWIAWSYGLRVMLVAVPILVGTVLIVGYALPISLPNLTPDVAQGRHFLEIEATNSADVAWERAVKDTMLDDQEEPQWLSLGAWIAIGSLALLGLVSRVLGKRGTIQYQMFRSATPLATAENSTWTRRLSAPQLAAVGIALALIAGATGLYIAYPPPGVVLEEMNSVQIELNLTLKSDPLARKDAIRLVARWQRLQSKLSLGDFLRSGRFNSPLRQPSEELRAGIEQLQAALVEMKPAEELVPLYAEARQAATRCRQAFEPGGQP